MADSTPPRALISPAAGRNRDPILGVLRAHLPQAGLVLEVAAGSGEHAVHFASALSHMQWLPTDGDPDALASIIAWRAHAGSPNLLAPLRLDAADPGSWPAQTADAVVCINMVHISPWRSTVGLVAGAARVLPPRGPLFLYGPFLEPEVETATGNLDFDSSLRRRDPAWGLRRLDQVSALCGDHGLTLEARIAMPANNLSVVYRKA